MFVTYFKIKVIGWVYLPFLEREYSKELSCLDWQLDETKMRFNEYILWDRKMISFNRDELAIH